MNSIDLPAPTKEILQLYLQLISDIDEAMATVVSALPEGLLKCGPGCSECCVSFSVFPLEAAFIVHHIPPGTEHGTAEGSCAMLCGDRCPIYAYRPVLCRTQGLPIGYFNDETGMIEVSACPMNFAEDFGFSEETVLFMDRFNARLAELNERYCRQAGRDPRQRIAISELIR